MLTTVDIYRFDDDWRWVRIVGATADALCKEDWRLDSRSDGWHRTPRVGLDLDDKVYLALIGPAAIKHDDLGNATIIEEGIEAVLKSSFGETIFDFMLFSSYFDPNRLLGRAWPLATELTVDVDGVQHSMAYGQIKLPQVLPDRVWDRMAAVEGQIADKSDAIRLMRNISRSLVSTKNSIAACRSPISSINRSPKLEPSQCSTAPPVPMSLPAT